MENYNNIMENEYNSIYGANMQAQQSQHPLTAIPHQLPPPPNHLHLQTQSDIINLSYHQREPIIAHNLPQQMGLFPTHVIEQMQQQHHQAALLGQHQLPEHVTSQSVPSTHYPITSANTHEVQQQQQQQQQPINISNVQSNDSYRIAGSEIPEKHTEPTMQSVILPGNNQELAHQQVQPTHDEQKLHQSQEIHSPEYSNNSIENRPEIESETGKFENEGCVKNNESSPVPVPDDVSQDEAQNEPEIKNEPEDNVKEEQKSPEPEVDPNQCRVCKNTQQLTDIFAVEYQMRIADLIMKICTNIRISERDYLPHMICYDCLNKLRTAYEFKLTCEETDKELRQKLKRSKNKAREPSDFILIDCNLYDDESEDDEINDDDDFKVSDEMEEALESDESFEDETKRKPPKKRPSKKSSKNRSSKSSFGRSASSSKRSKGRKESPPPIANKKKATVSGKKPDLLSTAKRLKQDVVYIEANYESSDDESGPAKKKKCGSPTGNTEGKKHICKECNEEFSSRNQLRTHRATHFQPGEEAPFRCHVCNRGFKYNINLTSHMQIHKDNYSCDDCGKGFSNKTDLKKHTNTEHKNDNSITYECSKCKRFFSSLSRYEKHRESCTSVSSNHHQKTIKITPNVQKKMSSKDRRSDESSAPTGKDLFKTVAPLTTTYWSDSFSD